MPCDWTRLTKAVLVSWLPWSVFRISGQPCSRIAWLGAVVSHAHSRYGNPPVPRVRLGGPGVPVERLDPHPAHQGGHVLAAHLDAPEPEEILEYPAPGEGVLEMELVEVAHEGQVLSGHRLRRVVDLKNLS